MIQNSIPFSDEKSRLELLGRLNQIPDVEIAPDRIAGYPRVPLSALREDVSVSGFLTAFEWAIGAIRSG